MLESLPVPPMLEVIDDPVLSESGVRLEALRLDQIHPLVNGNKWFKLNNNLQLARQQGHNRLLSFGGAYSNHLRALAAAARLARMESIGVVRGEIVEPLNPILAFAREQGMKLVAVSRADYRQRNEAAFVAELRSRFGDCYLIPEGGSNRQGVAGCAEIIEAVAPQLRDNSYQRTVVAVACGTGATLAGLVYGVAAQQLNADCQGFAVLKGADFLNEAVKQWLGPQHASCHWQLHTDYHFGGYAKSSPELLEFIANFQARTGIPLEPVYTGKLVYGIYRQIERRVLARGSRIVWLHTGGIY